MEDKYMLTESELKQLIKEGTEQLIEAYENAETPVKDFFDED